MIDWCCVLRVTFSHLLTPRKSGSESAMSNVPETLLKRIISNILCSQYSGMDNGSACDLLGDFTLSTSFSIISTCPVTCSKKIRTNVMYLDADVSQYCVEYVHSFMLCSFCLFFFFSFFLSIFLVTATW